MKKQIEVELRAKVNKTYFKKIDGLPIRKSREHDIYYKPALPVKVDWIVRIRKKDRRVFQDGIYLMRPEK